MKDAFEKVKAFHIAMGAPVGNVAAPALSRNDLRLDLIREELAELVEAMDEGSIVDVADALADIAYVVIGAAVEWGIPLPEVFDEVNSSNMSKTGGATRADGKLLKGPNYRPPNIAAVLERAKNPPRFAVVAQANMKLGDRYYTFFHDESEARSEAERLNRYGRCGESDPIWPGGYGQFTGRWFVVDTQRCSSDKCRDLNGGG